MPGGFSTRLTARSKTVINRRARNAVLDDRYGPGGHSFKIERHRQPWTGAEIDKLHTLAKKGMALKAIAKALTRSEESVKDRAKADGLSIAKLR